MIKFFSVLFCSVFLGAFLSAQPIGKGPAALKALADNIYYAEADTGSNQVDVTADDAVAPEAGTFTRISKHQDYGLTITRLVVDLGEGAAITAKDLPEGLFEVLGINKSDRVNRNITVLSVTDKSGYAVTSGRYVTIDLDFGFDSDADNAYTYIVTLNKGLGKYMKGAQFFQTGRTLRK